MYPKSPGPTFSHGPSLVSKARHTQPSRLARGPAPFPSRGGILRHRPACLLKRFRSQGSQTICAFRWPPQAPPHCAAVQATQRPARHRWRRCQATPAPPPPNPGQQRARLGGFMGGCLAGGPPHPPESTTKNHAATAAEWFTPPLNPAHAPPSPPISRRRHPTAIAAAEKLSQKNKKGWDQTSSQPSPDG